MKKLLLSICAILALGLPITLSSCDSGKAERTISDMGYGDWDINGDGEAGREVSFKGKVCNGSVGCSCSGFKPITDGEEWEKAYCKKCSHHRNNHK